MPLPSHGSSSAAVSRSSSARASVTPGVPLATATTLASAAGTSSPSPGLISTVVSRAMSEVHSEATLLTAETAPMVMPARKVMMAITAISARAVTVAPGTMGRSTADFAAADRGAGLPAAFAAASAAGRAPRPAAGAGDVAGRAAGSRGSRPATIASIARAFLFISIIDGQAPLIDDEPARVELVHQRDVVGGDQHGGAALVQLQEQAQQPPGEAGVDVAGRLVGEQDLRPADQRAGDGGALLLAAGEHRGQHMHALAQPHPSQQLAHLGAVARLLAPLHAQRQGDVLVRREMVEQAEILEHDADALAQRRRLVRVELGGVAAEDADQPARRTQRQEQQPQQRRLAGAGRPGEELEGARGNAEGDIPQHFRPHAVAQADILETNQVSILQAGPTRRADSDGAASLT